MPTTAFSAHFARELDVEQLGWLLSGNRSGSSEATAADLSQWADWIRNDVRCSSCGKTGAQVVRPSKARASQAVLRQAHFRFVDQQGGDAHHPFCEFYGNDTGETRQADSLLNFGSEKSAETRAVRLLVCKGIETGLFDQATIRAMRQWFFDMKSGTRFKVEATPETLAWARLLQRHPSYRRWTFHPAQAEMPAFDWAAAAKFQFTEENLTLVELAKTVVHEDAEWKRAGLLAIKHFGQDVFNVVALQRYYEDTLSLCAFVAKNSGIVFGKTQPDYYRFYGAPTPLLALCALMLFTSEWDMNTAIGKFAKVLAAAEPSDLSLGNVIGLNPFHDYAAWRLVILTAEVVEKSLKGFDYPAQLAAIEVELRRQHAVWKNGADTG
ncbi:hypothetical protein ACFHWW_04495 [Ensifer sp. P24N7]|uniref:hypothetical protein n=1 Tax=Sinorhizobium sp. P24N7 TaxID=3348358 RepID=UPI0035F3BE79